MDNRELVQKLKAYNETVSWPSCSELEKQYVKHINDRDYFYGFNIQMAEIPADVDTFLRRENQFQGLLKEYAPKLCAYLRHMTEFTCNSEVIRMDVRSRDFSRCRRKIQRAVGAFYIFYGAGLDMRELVYGTYRNVVGNMDMASVIAQELFEENEQVIGFCKEVLTSENNTAVLTRNVIIAIEQSHNRELQKLLTNLFLAAKLQEGLRQSVAETVDENNLDYFLEMLTVIEKENLLRFSSIQRAVLTWIGIGYEEAKEKDIRYIFGKIQAFVQDEEERKKSLELTENPLDIYLALYCTGIRDVETATAEAKALLHSGKRFVVASALIYLRMTRCFEIRENLDMLEMYGDDEWIMALFLAECSNRVYGPDWRLDHSQSVLLYEKTQEVLAHIGAKKEYHSQGFAWFHVLLTKEGLCRVLYKIMESYPEAALVERYLPYVASTLYSSRLERFMEKWFHKIPAEKRKEFLLKEIITSNENLQELVEEEYKKMSLSEADIIQLESRLKTKKAVARGCIVNVLAVQKAEWVRDSYHRLAESSVKTIRESAMELRRKVPQYFTDEPEQEEASGLQEIPETTFTFPRMQMQGAETGYGLYRPKSVYELPYESHIKMTKKGWLLKKKTVDLSELFPWDKQKVLAYLMLWSERLISHENDEYDAGNEYRQVKNSAFWPINRKEKNLSALPFGEVWREYFAQDKLNADEIFEIGFLLETIQDDVYLEKMLDVPEHFFTISIEEVRKCKYRVHFKTIFYYYCMEYQAGNRGGGTEKTETVQGSENRVQRCWFEKILTLLQLVNTCCKSETYRYKGWHDEVEIRSLAGTQSIVYLYNELDFLMMEDEWFRQAFPLVLQMYTKFNLKCADDVKGKPTLEPLVLVRAHLLGLIPIEAVYEGILDKHEDSSGIGQTNRITHQLKESYRDAYYEGRGIWGRPHLSMEGYHHVRGDCQMEVYETLRNVLDTIADTLLAMESGRLNEQTPVTALVEQLKVIRGVDYLILALHILEGEELCRQTYGHDRNAVFSDVIRHCYPSGAQDSERLKCAGFSEKRLVEVAMIAPQWIDVVNEVLGWEGFKEGCYYFTAHMKQYDYVQKKAEIARYTELEPEDLNDGAFDMEWCRDVYEKLGEKRFGLLYQAAKFLCENAFHIRARKYADACLGKTGKEEWRRQAEEKRNKDALNAYCICPLQDDADLLERYLYIQRFVKETKQYGAQRQASEKRAAEMALLNLARNSRFENVTRLSWMMESELINQNAWALAPQTPGGAAETAAGHAEPVSAATDGKTAENKTADRYEFWIEIDEQGDNEICVRKNGKKQKSIPTVLKKDEMVLKLKEIHTQWKEQYRRSRKMLEQAMEERTTFSEEELEAMWKNPIVSPMLAKLVLLCDGKAGFYEEFRSSKGKRQDDKGQPEYRIAHPYDLYEQGCWHTYQKLVFEKGIVQPFKQVFRELYLKLEEEKETSVSNRYSGYQIQPKKAAAALKSRRWNVSYENGLERIYYKENLVVNLYAEADWFSPADIEAPAIDYVEFWQRQGGQRVMIKEVDAVTFSETMRDLDMAVSVAYVGGVDPVTSFSTIELRRAIVECTCQLMKLDNVTTEGHFVNIKGGFNDYSVHLGSGVIHQSGGAAIHILPVHSAKRGKVYLPFLDEDPKSAEILSKIILLAEDNKIKDPSILSQIQTRKL